MLLDVRIRVIPVGKEQNLDVHTFLEQHIGTPYRCLDSSFVTVV
ncbi:Uncharacterised protein [Mycobacterium tuberculosis]|nr:Uncharacterised protein [Mycobacterium tuberculosis]